jgi:hypothetical protein
MNTPLAASYNTGQPVAMDSGLAAEPVIGPAEDPFGGAPE